MRQVKAINSTYHPLQPLILILKTNLLKNTTRSPSSNSVSFHVGPDCPNIIYYHSKLNPGMGGYIQVEELISNTTLSNQTEAISNFTFRGDIQLQALFENEQYSVKIASTPGGEVIGIEKDFYEHGSILELTAVPNEHYSFSKWNGLDESLAYNLTNKLLIERALDITALFELTDYNVSSFFKFKLKQFFDSISPSTIQLWRSNKNSSITG